MSEVNEVILKFSEMIKGYLEEISNLNHENYALKEEIKRLEERYLKSRIYNERILFNNNLMYCRGTKWCSERKGFFPIEE